MGRSLTQDTNFGHHRLFLGQKSLPFLYCSVFIKRTYIPYTASLFVCHLVLNVVRLGGWRFHRRRHLGLKVYKNVYKAAKDAPESFHKVHHDVLSLHAVLKEAGEIVFDPPMSLQRQQNLQTIAHGCTSVLNDLQALVLRYEEMGTQGKLTWKRLRWGSEDIVEYRLRITSNVTMLNAFMRSVCQDSVSGAQDLKFFSTSRYVTEQKLEKYLREIQRGGREASIISVQTADSLSTEDRAIWRAIRKDLESIGITAAAYEANHDFIRDWLIRVLDTGALDEQAISTSQEDETIQLESSTPIKPSRSIPNANKPYEPNPRGEASSTTVTRGLVVLKAEDNHDISGLKPSPSGKSSSLISPLGEALNPDTDPDTEALPKVHTKSLAAGKAGDRGRIYRSGRRSIITFSLI